MKRVTKNRAFAETLKIGAEAKIIPMPGNRPQRQLKTEDYLNALWQFARATLWFGEQFNDYQIIQYKSFLRRHFQMHKTNTQNFTDLVQRISIAKRHAEYGGKTKFPDPQEWLDIQNPDGLSGTLILLEEIKFLRQYEADCETGIQELAKGLLLYLGSPLYFKTCVNTLSRLKETALLQSFYNTIINLQYDEQ